MEQMVTKQVNNNLSGNHMSYNTNGYGFLTWITHEGGFSIVGAGDQLAVCDVENDVIVVITSDNQGDPASRHIIFHELTRHFFPKFKENALVENEIAHSELLEYLSDKKLLHQWGEFKNSEYEYVNGATYIAEENNLNISKFCLELQNDDGIICFEKEGKEYKVEFGLGKNKSIMFSFGKRAKADSMGIDEDGEYFCQSSGAWIDNNTFCVKIQVIDTYFACLNILISFKDNRATFCIKKSGQYVFDGCEGYVIAKVKK